MYISGCNQVCVSCVGLCGQLAPAAQQSVSSLCECNKANFTEQMFCSHFVSPHPVIIACHHWPTWPVFVSTGRVVTLSSDRGMLSPAHSAAYCIAKHGVETFSDVLREEMRQFGVSVSIIQPGHFGAATAIINSQAVSH